MPDGAEDTSPLTSGVLVSRGDGLLREAIESTLRLPPEARASHFEKLLREIETFANDHPEERRWKFSVYTGTDGSRIFRGGTGRSLVVDPSGALWRARSYEDFDTTYDSIDNDCRITSLTPRYEQMRRYPLG